VKNLSRREAKKEKKKKKTHRVLKAILVILILIFVALAGFMSYSTYTNGWGWKGMLATMMGHDSKTAENLEEFRILLMGVSVDISSKLTDTIMVASYNPKLQKATLISIPRDTFIGKNKNSANSYDKINALYQKGPERTLEAVNELTGLDIKYYAVIDTQALIKLVDAIGGVDFDIPIKMDYDDPTQDLHIHLEPGFQRVNGEMAEQLLRFRHNNDFTSYSVAYGDNDLGRMRTQRTFMMEVARQTLQVKNVLKINQILDIAYEYLETNVKLSNVKDYIPYAIEFNTENIQNAVLPGVPGDINKLSFYVPDKTKIDKLIKELFTSDEELEEEKSGIINLTTNITADEASKIKVEILNGSGNVSKLNNATSILKKKGYNITKTTDTSILNTTTILDNTGVEEEILTNIKELLKTGKVSDIANTSTTKADVTVIIGKDYK